MPDLVLQLAPEHAHKKTQEEVLPVLEAEVQRFSKFMDSEAVPFEFRGPLTRRDARLLTTYLVQKLNHKLDGGT